MQKFDDDMPFVCIVMVYHHPICAFGPKYDFYLIFMKICTWMHIKILIMDNVKIMFFSPPGVVAMLFFAVLATFFNFY